MMNCIISTSTKKYCNIISISAELLQLAIEGKLYCPICCRLEAVNGHALVCRHHRYHIIDQITPTQI